MSIVTSSTPRRHFLGGVAAATAALALGRWSPANAASLSAALEPTDFDESWIGRIKGKHKQVFDCVSANDGFGAAFAANFIDSYKQAHKLNDKDVTAVVSFRHMSMPLTLSDDLWSKYHIGEVIGVNDPKTNAPATRNPYRDAIMMRPGLTYEQLIANRGVIMTACNMALGALSGMAAAKAGVTADVAAKEWTAGLLPGVVLVPSGVYAVNRAQEAGCTYCFGG